MTRLLTLAFVSLVAVVACSEAVSPPTPQTVVGDTLLAGEATAPAIDAIVDKAPTAAPDHEVDGDFIRSRLAAAIDPDATVGAVNEALLDHGARITASVEGTPFVVLRIPPVADEAAAHALSAALVATGAFLYVKPEYLSPIKQARVLPASADSGISHLVPGRLPAAWNVKHIADTEVRVMVPDWYHQFTPMPEITALDFPSAASMTPSPGGNHGFHVAGIIAADHDASPFTGVFPRPALIDVDGVSMHNLGSQAMSMAIYHAYPATGNFLLSTSLGYESGPTNDSLALEYAMDALHWRILVANDVGRFLHLTAASNEGDLAGIPGQAFSSSPYNLARFQGDLFGYVSGLNVNIADKAPVLDLWLWAERNAPAALLASPNLLSVGSSSRAGVETFFSSRGSDVRAVGEQVFAPCVVIDPDLATSPDTRCDGTRARYSGTSMATPLVAGIAAYLWSLKPSLTPVQLRDILQDAYDFAWVEGVLDAYHAVLRLDNGLANAPIRRALLDVATGTGALGTDGRFDEQDIEAFRLAFGNYAAARLSAGDPALTDHSRYDLNGDGITGDTTRLAPFDLDADGVLSVATRSIEGSDRDFDEAQVSDHSILCYYAYSVLYEGDPGTRQEVAPECSTACPEGPQGASLARTNHQSECIGPLPGVPPSLVSVEGAGFRFDLGPGSAPVPGGGACEVENLHFDTLPPVAWRRSGTCTFPGGSVSGDVRVADDDRGAGSARAAVTGRFQTSASETSAAYARSGDNVFHYLVVTSNDVSVGTDGQMRARIAVRLKGEVPAFPPQCPGPLTQMYASIDVDVRSVPIAPDPTAIALFRGCWGSTTSPVSTREVTDTLTVPIDFRFGEPIDIRLQLSVSTQVVGTHSQSIDALAEVEYRLVEFLDLPLGALVRVGSGNRWGLPTLPAAGGALTTPERRPPEKHP